MTPFSRIALPLAVLLPVISACTDLASLKKKVFSLPVSQLQWIEIPGSGGIRYADVRGSLAGDGPYKAFVLYPDGQDIPYHYHSRSLQTVVLKGTFYITVDGKRTEYPAGSFYELPAHLMHFSGCAEGSDCLVFQYQDQGFDFVPQREEKTACFHEAERAHTRARSISKPDTSSSNSRSRGVIEQEATTEPSVLPEQKAPAALRHLWPFRSTVPDRQSPCGVPDIRSPRFPANQALYPDSP